MATIAQAGAALAVAQECFDIFTRGREAGLTDIALEKVAEKILAIEAAAVRAKDERIKLLEQQCSALEAVNEDQRAENIRLQAQIATYTEEVRPLRSALRFALGEAKRTPFNAEEYDAAALLTR